MRQEDLLAKLPEGNYPASLIVLLSDGENNQSIDPVEAAHAALVHDVPIDALGFGTTAGTTLDLDGFSVHTALDEATLKQITDAAGGTYYPAQGDQDPEGRVCQADAAAGGEARGDGGDRGVCGGQHGPAAAGEPVVDGVVRQAAMRTGVKGCIGGRR